jgi:general secretion pathway protein N
MMWRRLILVGLLITGFIVWLAPASLLRRVVNDIPGVDIVSPQGSLWNGSGSLVIQGEYVGTTRWQLRPLRLFALELAFDTQFSGRDAQLSGMFTASPRGLGADMAGTLGIQALNYTLAQWGVTVAAPVTVESVKAEWKNYQLKELDGKLVWPGGNVDWPAANGNGHASMPPLSGVVSDQNGSLFGLVVPVNEQIPLIQAELTPDGTFTLKISKLLTRLTGNPWPGSDPDHAIVIEMVDDLF